MSQFDKDDVEAAGLVKFDFLGLRNLTILDWAVRFVRKFNAELPDFDISFKMTAAQLEQIQKASAVMRLKELDISDKGVRIFNSENPGNEFLTDIGVKADADAKGKKKKK